jgi:hypothetical protein
MRQKSNDFAIVSLLHRSNLIARHIASLSHPGYKSTLISDDPCDENFR